MTACGRAGMTAGMDEESLQDLYSWVDTIHLSRAKRNIARDFSDGVLIAEVVKFHFPKLVEMHNYTPANSTQQKLNNWTHLNRLLALTNISKPGNVILLESLLPDRGHIVALTPPWHPAYGLLALTNISKPGNVILLESLLPDRGHIVALTPPWHPAYGKVFNRLNFYIPDDVVRKVTQCSPGVVELVLSTLRLKIGEKLKERKNKMASSPQDLEYYSTAMEQDMGHYPVSPRSKGYATEDHHYIQLRADHPALSPMKAQLGCGQKSQLSPEVRILMEEKEQALLAFQETIQILQVKVRRLEHLLYLKNVRIDDLTRRVQQAEQK